MKKIKYKRIKKLDYQRNIKFLDIPLKLEKSLFLKYHKQNQELKELIMI